ncbi:MAG: PAS domain-containing sensor histidine kinase, partial [Pseudorhizobium sp.]
MPIIQYPFIDIAVHEKVRPHFAGGEAVVVFSHDMEHVLWANGRGASLFGYSSVYDFLDQGPLVQDVSLRQIRTAGRNLKVAGDATSLTIRVAAGFRRLPVTGSCSLAEICGELVVLFHAPPGQAPVTVADRARSMIEGLDDPETHLAVVDGEGGVVASSSGFASLALTPQTARMLVTMSASEASRLVKRPVPTAKGYLPAAMAKVSTDPALHLLFVVEAVASGMDQAPAGDDAELVADATLEPTASEPLDHDSFEDVISAVAHLEDPLEPTEAVAFELPRMEADEAEAPSHPEALPHSVPEPASPSATTSPAEPDHSVDAAADEPVHGAPVLHIADEVFVFRRDARATRFVWKIDADGRFCEISEEFAKTVGPHAADINGMVFTDVASLFHLDPEGKIAELLSKRDTWSGKTIWWPVEGTSLAVPIDLAALPTYTRARTFDGFRGFGIIRVGDAVEHSHAVGLSLGAVRSLGAPPAQTPEEAVKLPDAAKEPAEGAPPADEQALDLVTTMQTDASEVQKTDIEAASDLADAEATDAAKDATMNSAQDEPVGPSAADQSTAGEDKALEWPKGERPALRLVDNQVEASDKVVPLDHRRSRRE